jgi:hypothetical protein
MHQLRATFNNTIWTEPLSTRGCRQRRAQALNMIRTIASVAYDSRALVPFIRSSTGVAVFEVLQWGFQGKYALVHQTVKYKLFQSTTPEIFKIK